MKGRKILKCVTIATASIPFVLIVLLLVHEAVGMVVNHTVSARQTEELVDRIEKELPQSETIASYTGTGNTSGTGNHVEMLSVVIFRSKDPLEEIEDRLGQYYEWNEWTLWLEDLEADGESEERYRFLYRNLDDFTLPDDTTDCYLLCRIESAPFSDNMEGH